MSDNFPRLNGFPPPPTPKVPLGKRIAYALMAVIVTSLFCALFYGLIEIAQRVTPRY